MALGTLTRSLETAADIRGVNYAGITEAQQVEVNDLGMLTIPGTDQQVPAFRAWTGQDGLRGAGGVRLHNYGSLAAGREGVIELSGEMLVKQRLLGHLGIRGGKGNIGASPDMFSDDREVAHWQLEGLLAQYADRMYDLAQSKGLPLHKMDRVAGDMGTNGTIGKVYPSRIHEIDPSYAYWQATASGKPAEAGGLHFRPEATGWGAFVTQQTLMKARGIDKATAALMGFGGAGAHYAHFATESGLVVLNSISEEEGVLATDHPEGLQITEEMAFQVGDNPKLRGRKLVHLARMIEARQPGVQLELRSDPSAIIEREADYFVPAAFGNVINRTNVGRLAAKRGIIEIANGPTTEDADKELELREEFDVSPDVVTNGGGLNGSEIEYDQNVRAVEGVGGAQLSDEDAKAALRKDTEAVMDRAIAASEAHGVSLRVGAALGYVDVVVGSLATVR